MEAREKIPEVLCIANSCFTVLKFVHSTAEVSVHDHTHLDRNDVILLFISNWLAELFIDMLAFTPAV